MSARPAPTVKRIDPDGTVTLVPHGTTVEKQYNIHRSNFDKATWIKIGSHLGVKWAGTPMHKEKEEIMALAKEAFAQHVGAPATVLPAPATAPNPVVVPATNAESNELDTALAILKQLLLNGGAVSEDKVRSIVSEAVAPILEQVRSASPTQLVINNVALKPVGGVVHHKFHKVAAAMSLRDNVYLVGPAGTGKTTIPSQVAEAMGLRFSALSCGVTDAKFDYAGYKDGNGNYNGTVFRDFWENGGVLLLDEFDNSSPELPIVLNSALANGYFTFPDGNTIEKHPDTIIVTAANTYGSGANAVYVGRSPIDSATLDRFTFIEIPLDEAVEDAMVSAVACDADLARRWVKVVRTARANVAKHGLRVMVTPRATVGGLKLLATGAFTMEEAFVSRIAKGLDTQQYTKVMEGITFG